MDYSDETIRANLVLLPIKFLQVVIGRTRPRHKSGTVIAQIRSPRAAIERRRRGAARLSGHQKPGLTARRKIYGSFQN
ncbi:hypothetical protein K6W21_19010 [Burkholderia latens]|uniref:hypothetical protein n=1 Tax=Burkholderia latens TaxID=488446 RepID=UPI001C95CAB9|nr:hypothetical protein [Burkholderia latens]MBY4696162.1 hypothetical protein [Burkholderia latens]